MGFLSSSVVVILTALATAQQLMAGPQQRINYYTLQNRHTQCPCTPDSSDFSFEVVIPVGAPEVERSVFNIIQGGFRSARQIFEDGLGISVKRGVERGFKIGNKEKCMFGELLRGTLNIDGHEQKVHNLKISGWALENGIRTAVCNCNDRDFCNGPFRARIEAKTGDIGRDLEAQGRQQ